LSELNDSGVHSRVEQGLTAPGGGERATDVVATGVFGEITERSGSEGGQHRLVVAIGGEDDNLCVRLLGADASRYCSGTVRIWPDFRP
jgi:hypothetical protein